jgi:hypothetical protein
MPLYTGYNVVNREARVAFREECQREFGDFPQVMPIIAFLRAVSQRSRLPGDGVEVECLAELWKGCTPEALEAIQEEMRSVLRADRNWLEDWGYFIYFSLPDEMQLVPGAGDRLELRMHGGQYVALHDVFGRPVRVADDHYRWPFSIDT